MREACLPPPLLALNEHEDGVDARGEPGGERDEQDEHAEHTGEAGEPVAPGTAERALEVEAGAASERDGDQARTQTLPA